MHTEARGPLVEKVGTNHVSATGGRFWEREGRQVREKNIRGWRSLCGETTTVNKEEIPL